MNERCDLHQADLSALLDGELGAGEAVAAVDHLADCGACRDYWRSARDLQAATAPGAATEPTPPADGWRRIEAAVEKDHRRSSRAWAWRVAAVLAVGIGLLVALRPGPRPGSPGGFRLDPIPGDVIEVQAGTQPMSERRFVEVTTELLRADPAYHLKMLEVMRQVADPEDLPGVLRENAPTTEHDRRRGETGPERLPGGRIQTS
ncbi:MAG: anti-sigma factor family protein [Thermoanaerobaculia bacterium]